METLTLQDRYVMIGLKLKQNGELLCMFCGKYAVVGGDSLAVVPHKPGCVVAECYAPGGGASE